MKKMSAVILSLILIASLSACGSGQGTATGSGKATEPVTEAVTETSASDTSAGGESTEAPASETAAEIAVTEKYIAEKPSEPITLTNKMTEFERTYARKRPFSLLDEQLPEPGVGIGKVIVTKEAQTDLYDGWLKTGSIDEQEYSELTKDIEDYSYRGALIDGVPYTYYVPDAGYDGGALSFEGGMSFNNKEEFFDKAAEDYISNGGDEKQCESFIRQVKAVFDAVINGTYTKLPDIYKKYDDQFNFNDPYADLRSAWEYDADALAEIKDHIDEYVVYDEQLELEFLVHVTLPPEYDAEKTYPVFFMTDGVWRLNDHAALYKAMERGEAADVILVSLAYDYYVNGTEDPFRDKLFIKNREALLNFITDDLMPYLGENYNIDYADSTLFGHSMGGVFSHYAAFMSDSYENQPFFRYIIGSPAFFNLYGAETDYDAAGGESEYGYFDRHEALDKKVFLCGGTLEDPDYSGAYHGHDSLLTGLKKLNERVSAHKADVTYKLYESHHYQYVPGMLLEFLKAEYPAE